MKFKIPITRVFDRIFLSIPLTIFLILFMGVISLIGIFPSFRPIFHTHWFLGYLCSIVLMMGYCSVRRWPGLINLYCYNKRGFSNFHSKGDQDNSFSLLESKEIFNIQFKNKNSQQAAVYIHQVLSQRSYWRTAYCEGENGGEKFFYEKAKLSVFGSYIVHLAITVLLLAGIITAWGGRCYDSFIREGETIRLGGTDALLTLEKFSVIPGVTKEAAEEYASRLRINRPGKPIEWRTLKVNSPLRIEGIRLYQVRFNLDIEKLRLGIFKGDDRQLIKFLYLGINQRVTIPELDIAVEVKDFIPDFSIDKNNQALSRSPFLRNPAAYILVYSLDEAFPPAEKRWVFRGLVMSHGKSIKQREQLQFILDDVQFHYSSGIKYVRNPGEFITYFGLILLVVGVFLSTFRSYRGLIITVQKDVSKAMVFVSARAMKCKNIFAFEKEMDEIVKSIDSESKILS